jgi:hypothetical protein
MPPMWRAYENACGNACENVRENAHANVSANVFMILLYFNYRTIAPAIQSAGSEFDAF